MFTDVGDKNTDVSRVVFFPLQFLKHWVILQPTFWIKVWGKEHYMKGQETLKEREGSAEQLTSKYQTFKNSYFL
jgi:hypothetical protein